MIEAKLNNDKVTKELKQQVHNLFNIQVNANVNKSSRNIWK